MKALLQRFLSLIIVMALSTGCTNLFFYPERKLIDNPAAKRLSPIDIYFKTPDGMTLHGWYFQTSGKAIATVLVLHGNAENLSTHVNSVLWLVPQRYNVFIFDYRGYGRSEGAPSVAGIHLDAEAALEKLLTLPGVDQYRIVVLGQSLGGAVGVYLAANSPYKNNIKALVIDSAFASHRRIAREKMDQLWLTWPFQYPLSLLFNDDYSPVKYISRISPIPVLILHGEQDTVVSVHHANILFNAAEEPKELLLKPLTGHIQLFKNDSVRTDVLKFLERSITIQTVGEQ